MLNLSRQQFRTLIWSMVEADDPIRHRWLTEHPDRDSIVNQLTTDAMQLTIDAHDQRAQNPTTGYWSVLEESEIATTTVEMVLGSPDVWEQVEDQFLRTPPTRTGENAMHELLSDVNVVPRSSPTGPVSPHED